MSTSDSTETQSVAPLPTVDYESASTKPKTWIAGTLIYTSAGLVILFCWLLWGDFAWSMKERAAQPVLTLLLKKFQASDTLLAMLTVSLPAAINIVLGPIISYRSDRHRGKWGRRIPYLIITTPIAAAAMIGVAFSPKLGTAVHAAMGQGHLSQNALILIGMGIFWTIFELATLSANAVFGGLINDVVPRPFLGRFYGLFRALSLIAGIIFNYWLFAKAENHYVWVFLGIATLYGVGFTMMCLKVKEGDYPAPPPAPPTSSRIHGFFGATGVFFKECFSNGYYIWIFLGWTFSNLTFIPFNNFSIPYYRSLNMNTQTYGSMIALTYTISLALAYFLGMVCDRFHPLRVSILAMLLYAVCTVYGWIFVHDVRTFAIALVAHGVLSGMFFTTSASLGQRLYPHARFAQFAAAATMLMAISQIMLGPILGHLLDATGHNYRYTFVAGLILSLLGAGCFLVVQRQFTRLGGPDHYVAPECNEPDEFPV